MGLLFLKNGHKKIAETIGISAIFALFGQTMVRVEGLENAERFILNYTLVGCNVQIFNAFSDFEWFQFTR